MLCELSIKNFAIIDDLRIRFSSGMTILSGETGAGKSIIINAVNLLLGSRAASGLIRTGCDTAELEAFFDVPEGSKTHGAMETMGFDPSDGLIIRRIIVRTNRHKIYINGNLSTIQILTDLTEHLAGISGQHAHQLLLKDDVHLFHLDAFADLLPLREQVARQYKALLPLIEKRKTLDLMQQRKTEQRELLAFQKNEIQAAGLLPDEDEKLVQERMRLKNGDFLNQSAFESIGRLYDAHGSAMEQLIDVQKNVEKMKSIDPTLESILEAVRGAVYQVEDITTEMRRYLKTVQIDPGQLEIIEERLNTINRLKRKYGGSLAAIGDRLLSITAELGQIENLNHLIAQTEGQIKTVYDQLTLLVMELSAKRKNAAVCLSEKIREELAELMMPQTRFSVAMGTAPSGRTDSPYLAVNGKTITDTGMDTATFMIAPNVGEEEKPLSDIASGGELSRVVLALKSILAGNGSLETLVFDEVDAGIGGEAAEVVGKKLASLAGFHQVICITHLPQIAKYGDHHFKISKQVKNKRTITVMDALSPGDRVGEIARMLGGKTITPAALDHAREMLNNK